MIIADTNNVSQFMRDPRSGGDDPRQSNDESVLSFGGRDSDSSCRRYTVVAAPDRGRGYACRVRPLITMPIGSAVWRARHALRWRWLALRGLTGEFDEPEDSDRCRALTAAWACNWPDADPVGHRLRVAYADRWVRFHNLPGSKRYAESPEEHAEIIHRQRTLLTELLDGVALEHLVVLAEDWGPQDLATGRSRRYVPGAWPWRRVDDDDPELGSAYLWARTELDGPHLDALLLAIADDQAVAILAGPDLSWLFCPYDGGVDIILPGSEARDALRDRHTEWLSAQPSGL